jgi:hypothetical protein
LRWFWWRINAWSEISAMLASFIISIFLQVVLKMDTADAAVFAKVMSLTVLGSSIVWLTVTFLTKPDSEENLIRFYRKVHPGGRLWKPIADKSGISGDRGLCWILLDWALGLILIYSSLFGMGKILLGEIILGILLLLLAIFSLIFIMWDLNRRGWEALKIK